MDDISKEDQIKNIVTQGYRDILKRDPDDDGLRNYINEIKTGLSIEGFHKTLRSSEEYKHKFSNIFSYKFGDGISWENHITELPLNEKNKLFYQFDKNNEMIKHITKYVQKGKLIDCGCHVGRWIEFFEGAGFDYTGIDQSSKAVETARQYHPKGKFVNNFLWDMEFNEEFDLAITVAVLQHNTLEEKKKILPKIHKALKKDGIFFTTESTVTKETKTQLTYDGWINLVEQNGFKFLESWHSNSINLHEFYLYKRL